MPKLPKNDKDKVMISGISQSGKNVEFDIMKVIDRIDEIEKELKLLKDKIVEITVDLNRE